MPSTDSFLFHGKLTAELAAAARLPAISNYRELAEAGFLLSYDINRLAAYRDSAGYIDRILKGANPGELPIQLPTTFDFVVNLKTARALGIELPLPLMGFVSEYIE